MPQAPIKDSPRQVYGAGPPPYAAIEVAFQNAADGVQLAGTLTVPRGTPNAPAVLLSQGLGLEPFDRDYTIPSAPARKSFRRAVEEDRLVLCGQPVLDLNTNEIHSYELLVRLPGDRSDEMLLPSAFLYVAERFGLIQAMDGWVVRRAIQLIAEHARAGRQLVLSVNLSGKSISDPKLGSLIEAALEESGIDPARLIFELTETAAIGNFEQAKIFATRLRGRGCQLALDDFGAGFGSFYYLKNFPFDYIKIDGGFIRSLVSNPMDQLVVQAIVTIARGLGKKTVAEFVTDQESVSVLRKIGVDCAQGYYIAEPLLITEALRIRRPSMG